ncbi:hypothetical protein Pogu_2071 [Pyrobaculum oguniense TE7]|uniref:Uncharacterized protein n=1 Tax=Pyrobaculum oguniense (strain DSM 13380 / JCM 10595 / TE7) TaxID=698757 RepID=H6QBA1_PYROT|nr:hypothetical protein Pogu_2071 [Pyrobaculum oguniense TE7]
MGFLGLCLDWTAVLDRVYLPRPLAVDGCGVEVARDEVPLIWATKGFSEFIPSFSSLVVVLTDACF